MTNEEMASEDAIKTIKTAIAEVEWDYPMDYAVAFEKAIDALENEDRYKARTLRYGATETVAMYDAKHDVYWMKCLSSEMLNALGYEVEE